MWLELLKNLLWLLRHWIEQNEKERIKREAHDFAEAVATGGAEKVSEMLAEKVRRIKAGG